MKKIALVALLLSMVVASSAFAAGGAFGVNGGMAKATGDIGDLLKMGFQAGAFGEYAINEQGSIGVGVDFVKLGVDWGELADEVEAAGIKSGLTIIPITLYSKWTPVMQSSIAPYVVGGGGFYLVKFKTTVDGQEVTELGYSENKPGFFLGAGVDYKVNPSIKIGVFGKFHDILTEGESTMFFHGGLNASFGVASK